MKRALTSRELSQIRNFIFEQGVRYLDIELELLDHFATAIEQHWETNDQTSIQEILQMNLRSFGSRGLKGFQKSKLRHNRISHRKWYWRNFIQPKRLWKFFMFFILTFITTFFFQLTETFFYWSTVLVIVISFVFLFRYYKFSKNIFFFNLSFWPNIYARTQAFVFLLFILSQDFILVRLAPVILNELIFALLLSFVVYSYFIEKQIFNTTIQDIKKSYKTYYQLYVNDLIVSD